MLHYESHDILVNFFYKLKFIKIENQLTLGSNPKNMQYSIFKSFILSTWTFSLSCQTEIISCYFASFYEK